VVVLGIHNRAADLQAISKRLQECGAKHVISPVELFDQFGETLGDRYWLTSRAFYSSRTDFIEKARQLLKDDASCELYSNIIEYRMTGDYSVLPQPDFENQYFSRDVPKWKMPLRLVDCGAYDGDTLQAFIHTGVPIEAVVAFEPDDVNFTKLSRFVSSHAREIPDTTLYPCGVYVSTTRLSFETGLGEASIISNKPGSVVQCVALDDVIPTFAPNLIKMDIEGAEYDALLGARQTINKSLPGLAISIYHRPEHLWQIPLLVEDIAPKKYDFYIRSHAGSSFDTVLYCIPHS
jgi:FkbM family methyltransferase